MKRSFIKEPVTVLGLIILGVILLTVALYYWQKTKTLNQTHAASEPLPVNTTNNSASAERKLRFGEIDLGKWIKRFSLTNSPINESREEQEISVGTKSDNPSPNQSSLTKLLANPEVKRALLAQQSSLVKKYYYDFIKELSLSLEEKEKLIQLIGQEQMQEFESLQRLVSGKSYEKPDQSIKNEIRSLLGKDQYESYVAYRKTLPERLFVNDFVEQMALAEMPLNSEQKKNLTQVVIEEYDGNSLNRMAYPQALGTILDSQKLNEEFFAKQKSIHQRILARAITILNEKQLRKLAQYQQNSLSAQEANVKLLQFSN